MECGQRYADLRAEFEERLQCQFGRGTWARRTRSWLGSFKRALSLKARKKSQNAVREPEWPREHHLAPPTGELPAGFLAELGAAPFIPELAAPAVSYHFNAVSDPAARIALCPSTSGSHTHPVGVELGGTPFIPELAATAAPCPSTAAFDPAGVVLYPRSTPTHPASHIQVGEVGYNANPAVFPPQAAFQLPVQASCPAELAAPGPYNANGHAAPEWYSSQPNAFFRAVPPLRLSTTSTQSSYPSVSSQSSISSVSSSQFANAATAPVPGAAMFASFTTSSPGGYGEDEHAMSPTNRQDSWGSTTTMGEFAESSLDSLPKSAQWVQTSTVGELPEPGWPVSHQPFPGFPGMECFVPRQSSNGLSEMEGSVPRQPLTGLPEMEGSMLRQHYDQAQEMEPQELSVQSMPLPLRPGPRPPTSSRQQSSFDSTADTVLELTTPGDDQNPEAPKPTNFSPIRQQTPVKKAPAAGGKKRQPETCCKVCDFSPNPIGRPTKMKKHLKTRRHKKNTGDETVGPRFPCWICPTTEGREDNLFQHVRIHHGVIRNEGQSWKQHFQSLR